jgi:hypothetical protein
MTDAAGDNKAPGGRLARAIAAHKKRTFWVVLGVIGALAGGISNVGGVVSSASSQINNIIHPYQKEQEVIDSLTLQQTTGFVNSKFGEPQQSEDLCARARICGQDTSHDLKLKVYRNEHYILRAVFDGDSLEFFAVTMKSGKFKPHPKWNYDIGPLGDRTYKQAFQGLEWTEAAIQSRPKALTYAEVTPLGGPGNYSGLVLASAPDGASQRWDTAAAQELLAVQSASGGRLTGLSAADPFRANSVPNTFGIFHDDGFLGTLLHEPQNAISILNEGGTL